VADRRCCRDATSNTSTSSKHFKAVFKYTTLVQVQVQIPSTTSLVHGDTNIHGGSQFTGMFAKRLHIYCESFTTTG